MAEKQRRQAALLRVVRRHAVRSQQELVALLKYAGFDAKQASVSRDLRELGLVKVNGRYQALPRATRQGRHDARDPLHELITSVEPIGANLIVVRTRVGGASTVAVEVDRRHADEIAGTLAGDDTVFVAVRSRAAQGRAIALLQRLRGSP